MIVYSACLKPYLLLMCYLLFKMKKCTSNMFFGQTRGFSSICLNAILIEISDKSRYIMAFYKACCKNTILAIVTKYEYKKI